MSIGRYEGLDHVMVTLTTSNRVIGRGEATVVPEFFGETADEVVAGIEKLASVLWDVDADDLGLVHAAMSRQLPFGRSAWTAVDEACYDAIGRTRGQPVWQVLGRSINPATACTWVLGLGDCASAVAEALESRGHGYRTFKLKAGLDADLDLEKVRQLRHALGPDARIRLDPNGAYSPATAIGVLEEMLPFRLEMVEQPCAADELEAMARVRRQLGLTVLADESVFSQQDLDRVVAAGAADHVNIKIQKVGGLWPALQLAQRAANAGLGCVVGSSLEIGPGASASVHLAAVCPAVAGDSDLAAGLQSALPSDWTPHWWRQVAVLSPLRGPGLGSRA